MVTHRSASKSASHTVRMCGLAAGYAFVLITGTAVMMAAFASHDDGRVRGTNGERVTAAEVAMQRAADGAVQQPEALLVASRTLSNDKRGY
ncbi:hypothetical protein ACFPOE_15480 [Caenimonas terrae]|uniref:Uncharacterized protein n=1 Tax=Caenimonas terrae TaxID=696074 RepID=A0ABW0NGA9_9BURK